METSSVKYMYVDMYVFFLIPPKTDVDPARHQTLVIKKVRVQGNCQSTLCLFVLVYCIILLWTVVNNYFEQINDDDDDQPLAT